MFYIRFFTIWNIKLHISLTSAKSCAFCTSNGVRWGTMKQSQQLLYLLFLSLPTGNYMFKVNNRNPRTRCEICSKLTIKIPERRHQTLFFNKVAGGILPLRRYLIVRKRQSYQGTPEKASLTPTYWSTIFELKLKSRKWLIYS